MELFWKNIRIHVGMVLDVELDSHYRCSALRTSVWVRWRILGFDTRKDNESYLDFSRGKKYSLERVMKRRILQKRQERGDLLQLPAFRDFMVVEEFSFQQSLGICCYGLDMLHTVRNLKIIEPY